LTPLKLVEDNVEIETLVEGETIRMLIDYDLFGVNLNGMTGFYIKSCTTTDRHLTYIPSTSEWCELKSDWFERVSPGFVTDEAEAFLATLGVLKYEGE